MQCTMSGANMAKLRTEFGLSRAEFADKLNLSRQMIRQYEVGASPIPRPLALACWALRVLGEPRVNPWEGYAQ